MRPPNPFARVSAQSGPAQRTQTHSDTQCERACVCVRDDRSHCSNAHAHAHKFNSTTQARVCTLRQQLPQYGVQVLCTIFRCIFACLMKNHGQHVSIACTHVRAHTHSTPSSSSSSTTDQRGRRRWRRNEHPLGMGTEYAVKSHPTTITTTARMTGTPHAPTQRYGTLWRPISLCFQSPDRCQSQ